ncbi:MAG: DNA polymerase III subunit delta [Bacteroidales bacterium]|nr:DNA polymerase III subunit delta [Bacteroidales bacterium]MBD5245160.1 DNA polymerase III subunit delta [Barnesiella sp.]
MADVITFSSLRKNIEQKKLAPVYLLHGEEGYYIDQLEKMFENVLPEQDKEFNQYVLYAPEVEAPHVVNICQSYPMMADRQMVIVKEVPSTMSFLNGLSKYVEQPNPTTVLVLCVRGATFKGKEFLTALKTGNGIVFESKKLNERSVDPVIAELLKEKNLNIEPKALQMLKEHIGTDVSRIYNEINKLTVVLQPNSMVTPAVIEQNIGISKDYNNFEFIGALSRKDFGRSMKIARYFRKNPKGNPVVILSTVMFNFFTNLMIAYYTADKSERGLMQALGYKWPVQLTDIKNGMAKYSAWQVIEVIGEIRRFDGMIKGVGSRQNEYDLLDNLIYRIITAPGKVVL